ncbi:SDR family NAD(P)-dependent oxidoreductase [Palleronia pelagia]|uniref:3-oxoacyl-[acyl-carrier protein] reductase n=1 Tax=Palleronia pelagia TaxID=387096 RepID=A0A1H8KPW4_9RHOB|nr:SDR family NAD(P)-dependent oxidoreductase [Palleronia pelagia]SEN94907.1 3-oxoacyl-[acyl-carrier protein] reductase [Palleronia pelagia]
MDLTGTSALVTGGSGGLGRLVCSALAGAGARVAVGYLEGRDRAERVCDDIAGQGGRAIAVRLDQGDQASIDDALGTVVGSFGELDILVNNAAMAKAVPFPDLDALSTELWDRTMAINLRGPWLVSRAAARHLKASGRGRIVNVSAMAGMRPMGASIAQSVGKAGVIQLTRCLAVAMAPDVTVNCVAPGLMEGTELTKGIPDAFVDGFRSQSVLGRTTSLDDVAAQVVQFCRADSVTGQTLVVDGGVFFH